MLLSCPVAVDKILTHLFGDAFVDWEPETLEIELLRLKHDVLSKYGKDEALTNMINAIRAIKSRQSYALQEWHLFEKVCAALTGKPISLFDAQPPSNLYELMLAVEFTKAIIHEDITKALSEETLFYIGAILTSFGVLGFVTEPYKSAIALVLKSQSIGDTKEVKDFADKIKAAFKNKDKLMQLYKASQENPDKDLFEAIDDVSIINSLTAALCYLTAVSEVAEADQDIRAALSDDRLSQEEPESETGTHEAEGINPAFSEEILAYLDNMPLDKQLTNDEATQYDAYHGEDEDESESEADPAEKIAANRMPRSGIFKISPDPDKFDSDHSYDPHSNGAANSAVSTQKNVPEYSKPGPKSMKVISDKNLSDKANELINSLFGDIDI